MSADRRAATRPDNRPTVDPPQVTTTGGRKVAGYRYRFCDVDVPIAPGATTKCVLPHGHDGDCAPVLTAEVRRRARDMIPVWCTCGRSFPSTTKFNAGFCPVCVAEQRQSVRQLRHKLRRAMAVCEQLAAALEHGDEEAAADALAAYQELRRASEVTAMV